MDYTISVTQNKIRRLPKPYASRCTDYLQMGWKKTFYGYLDQNVSVLPSGVSALAKIDNLRHLNMKLSASLDLEEPPKR